MSVGFFAFSLWLMAVRPSEADPGPQLIDNVQYSDGVGRPTKMPKPAILLFYATWCAPCRLEIGMIDKIERAAGGVPVIVVPVDAEPKTRLSLRRLRSDQVRYVSGSAFRLMDGLAGQSSGLPVSIAIDRDGRVCGVKQRGLQLDEIGAMLARCRR